MQSKTLHELTKLVMDQAAVKGFGTKTEDIDVAEKIALIHSEISEAYEAYRHKHMTGKHGFEMEMGDAIQRILHLCGALDIDIEKAILDKINSNENRKWDWQDMNETHK
jgi:NTP pyrophosphatase (non-canonical NTP hydrolase)